MKGTRCIADHLDITAVIEFAERAIADKVVQLPYDAPVRRQEFEVVTE
jgi:hypothetical protein